MRLAKWSELAEASWKDLKSRSPAEADDLSFAVARFAETGEGNIEIASAEDGTGRLYVGAFILMLGMPRDERIVEVLWMYRRGGER